MDPTKFAAKNGDIQGLLDQQLMLRSNTRYKTQKNIDQRPIPTHEPGRLFVKGPIPFDWLQVALAQGGKAGNLALAIWWLAGMEQRNPIRLTKRVLNKFHISTRTARRLLIDFETAGLLTLDRKRGRGPNVTLLSPTTKEIDE